MFRLQKRVGAPPAVKLVSSATRAREPYDVLERLVEDLQATAEARPFNLFVDAIADGVGADAVVLYALKQHELVASTGRRVLPPDWCRQAVERLSAQAPLAGAQVLCSDPAKLAALGVDPVPASVALILVSASKQAWALAVSLNSGRTFNASDIKLMSVARRIWASHAGQARAVERLKETLIGVVHCLTAAVDAKDPYTGGHSERVARIAVELARHMNCAEAFVSELYLAGLLHDIGKMGIKDSVLQKPGRLTEEEMRHVQEHPVIGDRIVAPVRQLAPVRPGVRHHHERYDGAGYPDGLKGTDIPLQARILAVADACDAMMSARPYRPPMPTDQIEAMMTSGAGTQWDPAIIEHFMACRRPIYAICQRGLGKSVFIAIDHALRTRALTASQTSPVM